MNNKDAYYFTHDSNSKDDPKCMMLIEALQLEGYGIFWILVETLRDQPDYRYPLALVPALARRYNTTKDKVSSVIYDYGLFQIEDKKFFYSESLDRRMIAWDNRKEKFRLAGIESGKVRRLKSIEHRSNNVGTSLELIDKNIIDKNKIKDIERVDYTEIDSIIDYYNKVTSQKRRYTKASREHISARLEEGFTIDDCKKVIDIKYNEWKDDKEMSKYITIETFFRPTKFEKYLNQEEKKPVQDNTFHANVDIDPVMEALVKRTYEENERK